MNKKGFINVIVIGIAVAILLGVAGYFVLVKQPPMPTQTQQTPPNKETIKRAVPPNGMKSGSRIPSSPTKLGVSGAPAEPADQVLTEITILSQAEDGWKLHIDKIRDYIRYPAAINPQLNASDTVSIRFNGWLDTFQSSEKICPAGYIKSSKTTQAGSTTQPPATRPQPKITIGEKYLAKLYGCFAEIGGFTCPDQKSGWSGWLYSPTPTVIEYECVKRGPGITPPPVEPQR